MLYSTERISEARARGSPGQLRADDSAFFRPAGPSATAPPHTVHRRHALISLDSRTTDSKATALEAGSDLEIRGRPHRYAGEASETRRRTLGRDGRFRDPRRQTCLGTERSLARLLRGSIGRKTFGPLPARNRARRSGPCKEEGTIRGPSRLPRSPNIASAEQGEKDEPVCICTAAHEQRLAHLLAPTTTMTKQ